MDVRCVTVCTRADGWFPALQEGCRRLGIPLVVLGWGQPWGGFMWRMALVRRYVRSVDPSTVLCCIDAYDVVPLIDVHALAERYRALTVDVRGRAAATKTPAPTMNKPDGVVIGVENPLGHRSVQWIKRMVFGRCRGHVLNAGGCMGPAATVQRLLEYIASGHRADDQKALNGACAANPDQSFS